jgi:RND family efflux transporter MFP subunit
MDRNDPGETFLNMPVASPINGWVGRWMVKNIGAQITPTTPVVTVVDDDFLRTTIYLSTSEWISIDDKAVVSLSVGDEKREGRILSIARAADSISGRGSAVIEVENRDHQWRVGMIARVRVDLDPKVRMLVSSAALNITDQGTYVFVIENETAKRVPVKFALVDSDTVEILEGIEDGAAIVVAGGNFVTDKAAVKVVASEKVDEKAH